MVSSNVLSTPPKHLFGCLIQIKSIKSPYFFWVKSSNVDHVDHVLSWMIPHQVAPKSLPRSPAHAFHRRGDSSTSWGISQPPGFHYTAIPMFISWNHHDITMKSPWNHHEITMKSPWNHHEITMKWSLRRTKRSWKTRKLRKAGAMKVSSKVARKSPELMEGWIGKSIGKFTGTCGKSPK